MKPKLMMPITKDSTWMSTRDGVKLAVDIYRPQTTEKLPVLLMRQPYGKKIASTVVYAHPRWYARQGYIIVIQDVRGTGESQGKFLLFESEIEDGKDTLDWVTNIDGSNGKVGMYGFSYQGMTQLYAAITKHPALKTICPSMIAFDLYADWAYENGAFCYQSNLSWAIQLAAEVARLRQDLPAYRTLYLASRNLPIHDIPITVEEVLRKYCPSNFYYRWLTLPPEDDYWQRLSPQAYFQDIDLPMLHIGGWFDPYLRGNLNLYQQMAQKSQFQQCLIIGPWGHIPWGNTLGDRYYTQTANNRINEIQIAWFDKYLKGKENHNFRSKNIQLFQMGSNQWLNLDSLPAKKETVFYLKSTGLANLRDDDGVLVNSNSTNNQQQEDIIVHDYWRSLGSFGGHASIPAGSFDRGQIDNRSDVITYTSEFLDTEIEIVGEIELVVYLEADAEKFSLSAIISQVFPDGKVYNICQGQMKVVQVNSEEPIKLKLQTTCIKIEPNTAIRLSISTANFPAYSDLDLNDKLTAHPLTLRIFSGGETPSRLHLKLYS